jgi:hypothetical protein
MRSIAAWPPVTDETGQLLNQQISFMQNNYFIAHLTLAVEADSDPSAKARIANILQEFRATDDRLLDWEPYKAEPQLIDIGMIDPHDCDDEDVFEFYRYNKFRAEEDRASFEHWKFTVMGAPDPRKKAFYAIWGSWEQGVHSYEPAARVMKMEDFTEDSGYDRDDIEAVQSLEIGESYKCISRNHSIFRIPLEAIDAAQFFTMGNNPLKG